MNARKGTTNQTSSVPTPNRGFPAVPDSSTRADDGLDKPWISHSPSTTLSNETKSIVDVQSSEEGFPDDEVSI